MRTCLVTGGAGFIGSHIVDALVARGDRVRVLDDLSTGTIENLKNSQSRIELLRGSLLDEALVSRAVEGVDCVFHEAALASVPRSIEYPLQTHAVCATGTLLLLHAAVHARVKRFVYAGSSSAYGDQPNMSKRESDSLVPISPYGAAKLAGELYCTAFAASFGLETVCLRYFNVFGPRQDPHGEYSAVIPKFITAMIAGRPPTIFGDGSQSRDFTYIENVVAANLLAAETPNVSGRVFNAATGQNISLLDLVDSLNRVLGTQLSPKHDPPRVGDIRESLADISQARAALGYEPTVAFHEGLRKSIDYYLRLAGTQR